MLPKIKGPSILITSDQVVLWNGEVREKPVDEKEARKYLKTSSLFPLETVTSMVVINTTNGQRVEGVDIARVYFKTIPDEVIEQYIREGGPYSHAGGFSIDDPLLRPFVDHYQGTSESIMGLPKELTEKLIKSVR